jgi:hypothetical protein
VKYRLLPASRPLVTIAAAIALLAVLAALPARAASNLPVRAIIVGTATDGMPTQNDGPTLPPADAAYCGPSGGAGSTPPNSVIGLITIGGQPAPVNTIVQLVFAGKVGPADYVKQAGGYRVDYAGGPQGCANQVGAPIAVFVNGQVFNTNVKVGDEAANPLLRFDIAVP